jgi:hypothetical protein
MFEKISNELSIRMDWFNSSVDSRIDSEQSRLNVNNSVYWANISNTEEIIRVGTLVNGTWNADLIEDDYLSSLGAQKLTNLSHLNDKITLDADNITNPIWIESADEGDLNVNSSVYWAGIDEISDLNNRITLSKDNITDENWIEDSQEPDLNVNSSNYWDGISSQNEITHTGNLTSLNVTGNVTASWFNGQMLWEFIVNKFITAVGEYFFMDGSTLKMNTTELNATIDERTAIASNLSSDGGIKIVGTALSVEAGNGLRQETDGLAVADAGINDTLMQYKLGQNLTIADSPEFTDLTISNEINPASNTTLGKGLIIPQGEYVCFDAGCTRYIYLNSTGSLIIV